MTTRDDARGMALLVASRFTATFAHSCCFMVGILGTAVYGFGASVASMTLLTLVVNIGLVAGNMVGGSFADAWGPRRTLVAGLATICALGVIYLLLPESFYALVAVAGAYVFVYGCIITCFSALPPFVVGDRDLARANSLLATAENAAYIAGPFAGGVISLVWSSTGCFVVLAVCAALAIPFAAAIPVHARSAAEKSDASRPLAYAREGFRVCFSIPVLATLVTLCFLAFFAYGAFDPLETVFYRDVLNVGVEWTGWLSAILGFGAMLGSLALMRLPLRLQNLRSGAWLAVLVGAGTIVYVGTANPYVAALGQCILGFAFGLFEPLMSLLAQRLAPREAVGRVIGVFRVCQRLSGVIPLLAAPSLASAFGVQPVLVGAGCLVTVVGSVFAVFVVPRVRG